VTTIAWDGKTLAGDSRTVNNGLPRLTTKVHRLDDGRLYAGSGDAQDAVAVRNWLNLGGEKPKVHEHFKALLIELTGLCVELENALVPMPVHEPYHAIGSGRDFAILAMRLGKSSTEAVALAMEFDVYTGGYVDSLMLIPPETHRVDDNVFWLSEPVQERTTLSAG
jgi:hypothetical protein